MKYSSIIKGLFYVFFISLIVGVTFFFIISYQNNHKAQIEVQNYTQSVNRTQLFHSIDLNIKNIESNQRAYILTDNTFFLSKMNVSIQQIIHDTISLKRLYDKNSFFTSTADSLLHFIDKRIKYSNFIIQKKKSQGIHFVVQQLNSGYGNELSDNIHSKIQNHIDSETLQINEINKRLTSIRFVSAQHIVWMYILILCFILFVFLVILKFIKVNERIRTELTIANDTLTTTVHTKTQELSSLVERFNLVNKASNDAIWDWDLTTNQIWGNENYLKLLNKTKNDDQNFTDYVSKIHPEDIKISNAQYFQAIEQKKTEVSVFYRFQSNQNEWIFLHQKQIILYDELQNPFRTLGAITDISNIKNNEIELLKEKEISDSLINSLPGVFYMFDSKGKYIKWNQNLLSYTGYDIKDMSTLAPLDFIAPHQRNLVKEKIGNVFTTGYQQVEACLYTKQKEEIAYWFTGKKITIEEKDYVIGVGIDISEKLLYEKQLIALANYMEKVREEERTFISREIHDEIGQLLTGLKIQLAWIKKNLKESNEDVLEKMNDSVGLTEKAISSLRNISSILRPSILDDLGLIPALEWQLEEFQKRYHIETTFTCNVSSIEIVSDIKTGVFRVFQECLNNVIKHSKATQVDTSILIQDELITISIQDNGIGFNPEELHTKKSFGILGMKERISILKGTFHISSKINQGSLLVIKIPLD